VERDSENEQLLKQREAEWLSVTIWAPGNVHSGWHDAGMHCEEDTQLETQLSVQVLLSTRQARFSPYFARKSDIFVPRCTWRRELIEIVGEAAVIISPVSVFYLWLSWELRRHFLHVSWNLEWTVHAHLRPFLGTQKGQKWLGIVSFVQVFLALWLVSLLTHYNSNHSHEDRHFTIRCDIKGCTKEYCKVNSFTKHVRSVHSRFLHCSTNETRGEPVLLKDHLMKQLCSCKNLWCCWTKNLKGLKDEVCGL